MIQRRYSELIRLKSYDERLRYLMLENQPFSDTFGRDRYLNQAFYASPEWKQVRDYVILRDNGCDLGIPGMDILGSRIIVHHMNPVTIDELLHHDGCLFDPEFLITVTHDTHNAIHFADERAIPQAPVERRKNDTCPWKE